MSDEEHFDIDEFVAEANRWDDLYLNSTIHAVELYHRSISGPRNHIEFLSRKNRGAFKLTNPFSKRIWLRELLSAFLSDPKRPETKHEKEYGRVGMMTGLKRGLVACALVTFTDENWACPDTAIEFDLNRAKQKVRNALNGLSFVAAFEAAHYVNEELGEKREKGQIGLFPLPCGGLGDASIAAGSAPVSNQAAVSGDPRQQDRCSVRCAEKS